MVKVVDTDQVLKLRDDFIASDAQVFVVNDLTLAWLLY